MKTYCCCYSQKFLLLAVFISILELTYSQPPTPKFGNFKGVTTTSSPPPQSIYPTQSNSYTSHDPNWEMNQRILQQSRVMTVPGQVTPQKPTPEELKREITNTQLDIERRKYVDFTEVYLKSFKQFLQLNPDSFSIAKAVYLSENPWYGASGKSYNNAQGGFNFSRGLILLTGLEEKRGSEKESNNKQKNP